MTWCTLDGEVVLKILSVLDLVMELASTLHSLELNSLLLSLISLHLTLLFT